jgi:hypothetical protein
MARYIVIDNCSGYIFGDSADLDGRIFSGTPLEYAAALHVRLGDPAEFEETGQHTLASNESGYHVYRADVNGSEAVPIAENGQDREAIEAVIRDCEYVTTLRRIEAEAEAA